MKRVTKKVASFVLAMLMGVSVLPMSALATDVDLDLSITDCDYYNVIEKNDYDLAPGAVESEIILNDDTGNNRNVVHVIEVDLKNPNISVMPTYKGISEEVDYSDSSTWGSQIMSEQVAHVEENLGLNVVGAMNVSLSWGFDHPYGLLIYNGKVLYDDRENSPGDGYLAIMKDGTAELRDAMAELTGEEWMAQTVCMKFLVRNGECVNNNGVEDHTSARAPRSVIGIKEDGTLVLMMNDGRQSPYSAGFTSHEMAQMMLDLGCVDAINCDGGGSATFITERTGTGELSLKSKPSDGSERATLTGIAVISKAISDGVFASATLTASSTSVAPHGSTTISVVGADAAGGPATFPEDLTLELADASYGTISESGVFTAGNKIGDAVINAMSNGEIVGSTTIHVFAPDSIGFEDNGIPISSIRAIAGEAVELPLVGFYNNIPMTLNADDVTFTVADVGDGTFDNMKFTPNANYKGEKEVTITATLKADPTKTATVTVVVYGKYEVEFNFNDADGSNYRERIEEKKEVTKTVKWCNKCGAEAGTMCKILHRSNLIDKTITTTETTVIQEGNPKSIAWDRDITDTTKDKANAIYSVTQNPSESVYEINYTFGVDMTKVSMPSGADTILKLVDSAGNYGNAWEAMCSLAPRITTDTIVTVKAQVDTKAKVDVSDAFIVSDFFKLNGATVDENNVVTLEISWIAQASAVDFNNESPIVIISGIKGTIEGLNANTNYTYDVSGGVSYHLCMLTSTGYSNAWMLAGMGGGAYEKSEGAESGQNSTQGIYLDKNDVLSFEDHFTVDTAWLDQEFGEDGYYYVNNKPYHYDNIVWVESKGLYYYCPVDAPAYLYTGFVYSSQDNILYNVIDGVGNLANGWHEDSYYVEGKKISSGVHYLSDKDGTEKSYYYNFNAEGLLVGKYTGVVQDGEVYRYAYMGELKSGWQMIGTDWYYFDKNTMAAANGELKVGGVYYNFEEDGRLVSGVWANAFNGYRYYYGPSYYKRCWKIIDGNWYCFDSNGYRATGISYVGTVENYHGYVWQEFDSDGVYIGLLKGVYNLDGTLRYYEDGEVAGKGLICINGDYYYADGKGTIITNKTLYVGKTSCELPAGNYTFDINGKMVGSNASGEIVILDGVKYYYESGKGVAKGLVRIGEDYYYAKGQGKLVINQQYYVSQTNCDLPAGNYRFDKNGKMIGNSADGEIVTIDGVLYYYENGRGTAKGLVRIGEDYYYAKGQGKLVVNEQYYVGQTNCDLPAGNYRFDESGKMIGSSADGEIVTIDGVRYYYENGKTIAKGLVLIGDDYYYVKGNGELVIDCQYYVSKSDYELPIGNYLFDEEGKIIGSSATGEIVTIDGVKYYYKNGKPVHKGLVCVDGDYYWTKGNGEIITNQTFYAWKTSCDLPIGNYLFDGEGKVVGGSATGEIVTIDGVKYYYVSGKPKHKGLVCVDGDYYWTKGNGEIITNQTFYAWKTSCDLPIGNYLFDEEGKVVGGSATGEIVTIDGVKYYYESGKPKHKGLVCIDGDYYWTKGNGEILTNQTFYAWKTSCDLPVGSYLFDEEGKVIGGSAAGEIVTIDGVKYYYESGKPVHKGLICVDGDYYWTKGNGEILTNQKFYVSKTNCDLPVGNYLFNESGKMVGSSAEGEIVEIDGVLYYYKAGKGTQAGLIYIDGYYYFAAGGGKLVTNQSYYVWEANRLLAESTYTFDDRGRIIK